MVSGLQALGSLRELAFAWPEPVKSVIDLTRLMCLEIGTIFGGKGRGRCVFVVRFRVFSSDFMEHGIWTNPFAFYTAHLARVFSLEGIS